MVTLPTLLITLGLTLSSLLVSAAPAPSLNTLIQRSNSSSSSSDADIQPPSHRVVAYMGHFRANPNDTGPPINLSAIYSQDSRISHVILFVSGLQQDSPHFRIGGVAPDNTTFLGPLWDEVSTMQSKDIKVMVSLGGAGGDSYLMLQDDFDQWYPYLHDFLIKYNLDGIDLDIEPGTGGEVVNGTSSIVRLIKKLKGDMKPGFIVSLAPVAADLTDSPPLYSGFDYKTLDTQAVGDDGKPLVDFYNGQFYNNWAACDSTETYDAAIQAGWDPSRIIMGALAAQVSPGYCNVTTLKSTISSLKGKYPNFGGFDGYEWSVAGNNDNLPHWKWYNQMAAAEGVN